MRVINTLREKGSKIIIVFIAVAIASFILTDLLSGQNSILTDNDRNVGEISGETISYDQFQKKVNILVSNYESNAGENKNTPDITSLRNQAWLILVAEKSFKKEYDDLGISVSSSELVDMVQGKNISLDIQRIFTDPSTNQFDKNRLIQTLNQLNSTPEGRAQWRQFEESLIPARKRTKIDKLLEKSTFVTDIEGERAYNDKNTVAEISYLYIPFYTIKDSLVKISDIELSTYIKKHEENYKVDWSKSMAITSLPIIASAEDSLAYRDDLRNIKEEFTIINDDSLYARNNTDGDSFFENHSISTLPSIIASNLDIIDVGTVIGPYIDKNTYVLYKMSDIFEDTLAVAKARHILINWDNESNEAKIKARKEAMSILTQIQQGENFSELARNKSKDRSSSINGGDLGWFNTGAMVKPFNDVVFNATKKGLIPRIIESQFGFHIIEVTEIPDYTKYKIATIDINIDPSDKTKDISFRKMDLFAINSSDYTEFINNAEKGGLQVFEATTIKPNDETITQLGSVNARQLVTWLFRDASEDKISPIYELENQYVIAVMTGEQEKGIAPIDLVRLEVTEKVKQEKKGALIVEKIKPLSGTLEEKATNYGQGANVYSQNDFKMDFDLIPNVGDAPEAIGAVFSLEEGEVSSPIFTESGIMTIHLKKIIPAQEIADYSLYSNDLAQNRKNRSSYYLNQLLEEKSNVTDSRYKFY